VQQVAHLGAYERVLVVLAQSGFVGKELVLDTVQLHFCVDAPVEAGTAAGDRTAEDGQ